MVREGRDSVGCLLGVRRGLSEKDAEGIALAASQVPKGDRLLEDRRKLGAFYTPERLSQILSHWAIQSASDTVLEPSFGGCGFLQSARERLVELGSRNPRAQIYGCDVDPIAFQYLADVLGAPVDLARFVQADFLTVAPGGDWPQAFSAILANPPYIPYQNLEGDRRRELSSRKGLISGVGGRASLWAYFIAHAVSFLAPGGRMAWVLPGAFLQADYAKPIRDYLSSSFSRVAAVVLRERIFLEEGTDEETIILLADGHLNPGTGAGVELAEAKTLPDLVDLIEKWDAGSWTPNRPGSRPAALSLDLQQRSELSAIDSSEFCKSLGEIANVQIGLVTGANEFFVLSRKAVEAAGLLIDDCTPILAKFLAAQGIKYTADDHENYLVEGGRGYLVGSASRGLNARLALYFNTFPEDVKSGVSTFKKRRIWWKPDDGNVPDAFFPVMHHYGPRIVLNPDGQTNTNTIHRLYFRERISQTRRKLVAISILTTFSQISAEMVGRRYGSGVLKHEPREAEKIRLLLPDISGKAVSAAFRRIDKALRAGDRGAATKIADTLIYGACGFSNWPSLAEKMSLTLSEVRGRRRPQSRPRIANPLV